MNDSSIVPPSGVIAVDTSSLQPIRVGPGCLRWDLPGNAAVRAWIVEIEAGAQWPRIDTHDEMGEAVFVASGELIEGEEHYAAGTYIAFGAHSAHRPRTDTGVRLFGFNVMAQRI